MKFYYFTLLLFALLCFSCQKNFSTNDASKYPNKTIDSLYNLSFSDNLSLADQIQVTNQGVHLAEKYAIDSLYLKGISNKASITIKIFCSAVKIRRVFLRMSFTKFSAVFFFGVAIIKVTFFMKTLN